MKDNVNIDDVENKLNDFKVRFPDSMTHEKTLKEDASLVPGVSGALEKTIRMENNGWQ